MIRRILSGFLVIGALGSASAKVVDVNTAKIVGINYCKSMGMNALPSDFSLVYSAVSQLNGGSVTDFYVFNKVGGGFVIVSGDDKVRPVLGWSDGSSFQPNIPASIAAWLQTYTDQINYAVKNNITPSQSVTDNWAILKSNSKPSVASKTTAGGVVAPLVHTRWGQDPFYNDYCPYDASASQYTLSGCVATAMAQLMKYWNWPRRGTGSHSYGSSYGVLSVDFGSRVYHWDSMPVAVFVHNNAVATLMSDAGISVDMWYGVTGSGAQVLGGGDCTETAFKEYFSYKPTLHSEYRDAQSDTDWVHLLKSEIDAKRPVIYTGYGTAGGHCFLADGYKEDNFIHFNWGWGYTWDGFYVVEHLTPGGTDFTSNQGILVGVEPDSSVVAAVHNVTSAGSVTIYPNPATDKIFIGLQGTKASSVRIIDLSGREITTVAVKANATVVEIPVVDLTNGIYFAEINAASGTITKKVVVAK